VFGVEVGLGWVGTLVRSSAGDLSSAANGAHTCGMAKLCGHDDGGC
jgi:hypothetical protein